MKKTIIVIVAVFLSAISYSQILSFDQIINWSGTGSKKAMLIIDFNDSTATECYAFGYRFDEPKTAEDMLIAIANSNPNLNINIFSGFLNDITYFSHSGIGGNPYYWATFTEINNSWVLNNGITEILQDNTVFGSSYTDWDQITWQPLNLPTNPIPAPGVSNIQNFANINYKIYPNPFVNNINIVSQSLIDEIEIYDLKGKLVLSKKINSYNINLSLNEMLSGNYILKISSQDKVFSRFITKM